MFHPRLKGVHYDMGLKVGKALKKKDVDIDQFIDLNRFQKDLGKKSQIILSQVFPEVCDEIRGLIDGLNYPYEEFASWLLCMGCCYEPREPTGCTTFCFIHKNSVFYGRNNDLPPFLKKRSASILYQPHNGHAFIGTTSSMINLEEGLNEHGLAVAMEFIVPTRIVPGINSVFLVRYLLEKCETTKEAINALKGLPIASACNIVLADKAGDMVVAECTPEKIFLRRPEPGENFLVAANHFTSKGMSCYNACMIYSSDVRYETASNALKNMDTLDPVEKAKNILGGKHGFMCQYHRALHFETIWSSVFDISQGRIYRAEGDPSRCAFKEDPRTRRL